MLYVIQIERELPFGAFYICRAAWRVEVVNLGPAGETRSDEVPRAILRNLAFVDLRDFRQFRPRTNKGEFADQDIPELWQFIDTRFAKHFAKSGCLILFLKFGIAIIVEELGAQLKDIDTPAILANTLVADEGRAAFKRKE